MNNTCRIDISDAVDEVRLLPGVDFLLIVNNHTWRVVHDLDTGALDITSEGSLELSRVVSEPLTRNE